MRTSQGFSLLAVAILVSCPAAYGKHGDAKNTGRTISGVASQFELLNTVIRSGEPVKIRVTLHNESTSPVEFRYVTGSFIEHVRIYDARDRRVPVRLNAPFLESGADIVNLRPGEQFVNIVTADLWQMYDLEPGTYELRFYYDLRLIADETLAVKSMKRYHSKDWILWDVKTYPLTVVDQEVSDATRQRLEQSAKAFQSDSVGANSRRNGDLVEKLDNPFATTVAWSGAGEVTRNASRATAAAEPPPSEAPITRSDVRHITRALRRVTKKPILAIVGITAEKRVPGAVVSQTYIEDLETGKRTPTGWYTRTDLVSVYMRYTDPAHVDVYTVRKVRKGWKIESKRDWFL